MHFQERGGQSARSQPEQQLLIHDQQHGPAMLVLLKLRRGVHNQGKASRFRPLATA